MSPELCPRCNNRDTATLVCYGTHHECLACGYGGLTLAAAVRRFIFEAESGDMFCGGLDESVLREMKDALPAPEYDQEKK